MGNRPFSIDDFGWKSTDPTCAARYVTPAILMICRNLQARRIFDLGCGNGALAGALTTAGYEVAGCDVDERGVSLARQAVPRATFAVLGVEDDPNDLGWGVFDVVVSTEVIEHLYRPRALPRFAGKLLCHRGSLVVTTPYHGYLKNLALSIFGKWDTHLDPFWEGGHVKLWSRRTLSRLLSEEGFVVERFPGLGRMPFLWKSMLVLAQRTEEVDIG